MGLLKRTTQAMYSKLLILLVPLLGQTLGAPFIPIPPAIANLITPGVRMLQAVVVPGTGGAGTGAVVVPGTAAMTVPAMTTMPAMMNTLFPALGLGIIKGILISQLLKPPKKEKKKYYAPHPPSYGYHDNTYADPYGGYDHHARNYGY